MNVKKEFVSGIKSAVKAIENGFEHIVHNDFLTERDIQLHFPELAEALRNNQTCMSLR